MTCYFRHLGEIFRRAEIQVTKENRREIDRVIQEIVGLHDAGCPETWQRVKRLIAEDEEGFALRLKSAWGNRKS